MFAKSSYPAYKPSGIPWLGDIPAHWDVISGRACYSYGREPNTGMKENTVLSLSYGNLRIRHPDELHGLVPSSFETYQVIEPGDIVCRPTDLQNDWNSLRFALSTHKGIITSAYMRLRPTDRLIREYGFNLLHTYDLMKVFYSLGSGLRQNLRWEDFKLLPCLIPPIPEQRAIVRYLDRAADRIRRYLDAQHRLVSLLEEERQATINQAVTRGLDADAPLKPSGIEWLGDVPAHWEISATKRVYEIRLGKMLQNEPRTSNDVRVHYLKSVHVQWDGVDVTDVPLMWASPREVERYAVKNGDLLVCEGGEGGRCSILDNVPDGTIIQNALHRVRPSSGWSNQFLYYVMRAISGTGYFDAINDKATIAHFTKEKFDALRIPLPPIPEQRAIVRYLDAATTAIDAKIARARRLIELLEEYRTRLDSGRGHRQAGRARRGLVPICVRFPPVPVV